MVAVLKAQILSLTRLHLYIRRIDHSVYHIELELRLVRSLERLVQRPTRRISAIHHEIQ